MTDICTVAALYSSSARNDRDLALSVLRDRCENYVEAGWLEYGISKAKEKLGT
jgi:hypothetical protein